MKNIQAAAALAIILLAVFLFTACACAAKIDPLPAEGTGAVPDSGTFRLTVRDNDRIVPGGYFTAALFRQDLYAAGQIEGMAPGDRVRAGGRTWTVKEVVLHTDPDTGEAEAYEVYPEEDYYSYLAFVPAGDGSYIAVIDDWTPVSPVGEIRVMLPLPDRFTYIPAAGGEEEAPRDAEAFIAELQEDGESFTAYNTECVLEDGVPVRVTHASYPAGPEEMTAASADAVPVWRFCHGLREGLETAVIRVYMSDCEEGLIPVDATDEETEEIRDLAINGFITGKVNDMCTTGGTWVYTFESPEGKYLLSVELYEGLMVSSDGMYSFSR